MLMHLIMLMVSQVYTCPQTQQVGYIQSVQLFTCQSYLNNVVFKNLEMQSRAFAS